MTEGDKFSKIRTILSVLFLLITVFVSAYTFYYFNTRFNKIDDQFAAQNLLIQEQSQRIQELDKKMQEGAKNSGGLFGQLGLDKAAETFTNMNPVTKGAEAFSKVAGTATDSINKLQQGAKKN
ncbi:hypothetical protein M153_481000947 [Pseudoloma neurophilia]|uniref:Uncharacterized protein n=1 Tax=Pseudoloma neurophilia TaxID=146866 RepID=A0A0R0LX92_9MICR|nr:hypothetical protein M153_481000947 [Pseudoloma neurophilia]